MEHNQKLPPLIKQQWVIALRRGEYKQCRGMLYDPVTDGYCCLGVLGHICGNPVSLLAKFKVLEKPLEGIPHLLEGPAYSNSLVEYLTAMNDTQLKSFGEIADYIEKNL